MALANASGGSGGIQRYRCERPLKRLVGATRCLKRKGHCGHGKASRRTIGILLAKHDPVDSFRPRETTWPVSATC